MYTYHYIPGMYLYQYTRYVYIPVYKCRRSGYVSMPLGWWLMWVYGNKVAFICPPYTCFSRSHRMYPDLHVRMYVPPFFNSFIKVNKVHALPYVSSMLEFLFQTRLFNLIYFNGCSYWMFKMCPYMYEHFIDSIS